MTKAPSPAASCSPSTPSDPRDMSPQTCPHRHPATVASRPPHPASAAYNHARENRHARSTVRVLTPSTSAHSASDSPPKYRSRIPMSSAERWFETTSRAPRAPAFQTRTLYTNLERLGGEVKVDSQPGVGTTVRLKLPLS